MDRRTYQAYLNDHGRRVANRAAYHARRKQKIIPELGFFYSMYGSESALPENERMRKGNPANDFDPCGLSDCYTLNACDPESGFRKEYGQDGLRVWSWLAGEVAHYGDWFVSFMSAQLQDISVPQFDEIANDQGEFTNEHGGRICDWRAGWKGWQSFGQNTTELEQEILSRLLVGGGYKPRRHPDPGTPEANAWVAERDRLMNARLGTSETKEEVK